MSPKEQGISIYLMGCSRLNYWKIGLSSDPWTRIKGINVPFELKIYHTHDLEPQSDVSMVELAHAVEDKLHKHYAARRVRGEWFSDIDLTEFISLVRQFNTDWRPLPIPKPPQIPKWRTQQFKTLIMAKEGPTRTAALRRYEQENQREIDLCLELRKQGIEKEPFGPVPERRDNAEQDIQAL